MLLSNNISTTSKRQLCVGYAFQLWCWKRLLRVSWTAMRSNQSFLKEISPEYSLEGLMLKLQYFGHLMRRSDSFEKTMMLGKTESRRRRGCFLSLSKLWELVMDREATAVHGVPKSWIWLSDWTELNWVILGVWCVACWWVAWIMVNMIIMKKPGALGMWSLFT